MADGSREGTADPPIMKKITFSASNTGHGDSKKCSEQTFDSERMKLSFYTEHRTSESCEKSDSSGVAADDSTAVGSANAENSSDGEDRKKRCFDRYDSSESSDRLMGKWIVFPGNERSRRSTAHAFLEACGVPHILGAVDCTQVKIFPPPLPHGVQYLNRKGVHSLNVQLIADVNCKIISVNARFPGRVHDSFIFSNCAVKAELKRLHDSHVGEYFLLGDSGYALEPWLMTPVLRTAPGSPDERYTKWHCRVRNLIERTNGYVKNVFRCLGHDRVLHYSPEKASALINTSCVLYNIMQHYRGVAVLSPSESGSSGSDITEPASPRSPGSPCGASEEAVGARMPPWVNEPAPGPRRLPAQAPVRRPSQAHRTAEQHRRITEFFNHKMKPQNGLKRDSSMLNNDDAKKKCLPKNGVTHDLEKYISYLSYTLSPKVLLDVGKQNAAEAQKPVNGMNGVVNTTKATGPPKTSNLGGNGLIDYSKPRDNRDKIHSTMNGFMEMRHGTEPNTKEKLSNGHLNGLIDTKKQNLDFKVSPDSSANRIANYRKRKVPIPASSEFVGRVSTTTTLKPRKLLNLKPDTTKMNGVVSSTTKLDSRMNGVTCGSNNLSLNRSNPTAKKETQKKTTQPAKRTNRKSSACIANSKNLTWSKANNLKQQVQLQKQNGANSVQSSGLKSLPEEASSTPKINVSNGVRQVPMTMNGNIGNLNVPVTNYPNCQQINIPQPCNGTVTSTNLGSFVAMPQNVMLTALRIPHNGLPGQTLTNHQPNNMNPYNRTNVNVQSPTKFVFPIMQNLNGAVVQIPNLMAKMPNFVLPQTPQRHDTLQNQQAQILINGTLLKLGNTMTSPYANVNKPQMPTTSQSGIPVMNKNLTGMPAMGVTVQPKPNYAVNFSHSVLVPQPGFLVTSVPNMNVKETWSYTSTHPAPSPQTSCSSTIVHHPPGMVANFSTPTLHSSRIPIAPVKPTDNPIQGTDPPSSTVKEPEPNEAVVPKCDFPWLSKTYNNNIVPLDCNNKTLRRFAEVSNLTAKMDDYCSEIFKKDLVNEDKEGREKWTDSPMRDLRKVEEVAKREDTLFSQITVLKDVSSNVQSSVIEANFCNTTESSESGIGTDKSIDSPSDSQTSKECDDDSSLSLSISVSSEEVQSCQKSPMLKQPKTLRFPPRKPTKASSEKRKSSTDTTSSVTVCLWEDCKQEFESDTDLLEHLQSIHVESQVGKENYVCQWERCKVRGKPSCSRLWLERHALSHGGNKPFKCIVEGCGRRFSTQILLERHVNNHFNETSPNASGGKKSTDSTPKLIRRNGKKLRYRRQPWSARMFDYFDSGVMERLAWQLSRGTRWRLGGACPLREPTGRHTLALAAVCAGTRYNAQERRRETLITYYPPNVVEDEWVPEKDVKRVKRVEIASLPAHTKVALYEQFCASYRVGPASPPAPATPATPAAPVTPARRPTSSRLLNNLLKKKDQECSAPSFPVFYQEDKDKVEVTGAKKRKQGRRYGGNAFWPCGR